MKRAILVLLAIAFLVLIVLYAFRGPLTLGVMDRVIASRMGSSLLDELPDGLHVGLCGAGSPLPDPNRSGPCSAIIAEPAVSASLTRREVSASLSRSFSRALLRTHGCASSRRHWKKGEGRRENSKRQSRRTLT